jgi:hypothetical protein
MSTQKGELAAAPADRNALIPYTMAVGFPRRHHRIDSMPIILLFEIS